MMIIAILKISFMLSVAGGDDALQQSLPGLPILAVAAHQPPPVLMFYGVFVGAFGDRVAVDALDLEAMWGLPCCARRRAACPQGLP
jgi:hypothetical protein